MKTSNQTPFLFIIFTLAIQLAACGVATPAPTATATALPRLTPSAILASTEPPQTPSFTSTPSPIPISSPPDGLRMGYIIDGNLYFQDGSNPPLQLTNSGEDWHILFFSEDGEKLFFLRGITPHSLYSINVDGSQEKALVTNNILQSLSVEYDEATMICHISLVPNTHVMLFKTCFYPEPNNYNVLGGNNELIAVDGDTGDVKKLLPPGQVSDYYSSPDGRLLAIHAIGHVNLFDINGEIIRRNLLTYVPSEPIYLPPDVHWIQDSSGLIFVLPFPTFYDTSGGAPNYTVWRYALDGSSGTQVPLDPMPKDLVKVSPDGNWVAYRNDHGALYLGDLRDGSTQLFESQPGFSFFDWNADSKYFVYGGGNLYLISIDASPNLIDKGDFIGWLDANRYLYISNKAIVMGNVDGEKKVILNGAYEYFRENTFFTFVFLN